jgi:hypothetical protein
MAISVTINGTNYSIPTKGEEGWAANVTALLLALSSGLLQKSGGSFPLTAEVDFGNSFGLATVYIKSKSTNSGTSGVLRLASGDQIVWRNFNNTGNLILEYFRNTDFNYNILRFNGKEIIDQDSQQFLQNKIFGTPSLTPIEPSAIFEVRSTTKGALPYPRMTTAQRDAIPSPTRGLIIYNLTDDATQFYNGTSWVSPATITNTPTWTETNVAPTAASVESRFLRKNGGLDESTTKTVFDGLDVSKTFVDADVNIATDSILEVAHGFLTGDLCILSTTGVLPAPLALNTTYYIIRVDADNFRLATSYANAKSATPINITSALGGGTHTVSVRSGVRFLRPSYYPNGSPSQPSLAPELNENTGIYFPGANTIGVAVGGVKVGEFNSNGYQGLDNVLIVIDQKTAGTNGGTFTSGARRTRDLNTVRVNRITGASLSSNQITLPAGTYRVEAFAPAQRVGTHQAYIRNITGSADLVIGHSARSEPSSNATTESRVADEFTLAVTSVIELQHQCSTTNATDGFGVAANLGAVEKYTYVFIKRIV